MSQFVHLHCHSHYSLLNGLPKVKDLVKAAKERGFSAIALTDYGAMYGAIEFYSACQKAEIKPIIGFVAYVKTNQGRGTLVLLAENYTGYRNLMILSSLGHLEGMEDGKPTIRFEQLAAHKEHIIALSGGVSGRIPELLRSGNFSDAADLAKAYRDLFGPEYFYLELQDHPAQEGQLKVNTDLVQLSKELEIELVVTRDVHYLHPDQAEAQDILRCIGEGWKIHTPGREDMRHVDRSLNSAEDIASRFRHVPEAIENTGKIAERIHIEITLDDWHFAPVERQEGKTYDDMLREEAYACAPKFYPEMGKEITDRLDYELDIIKTKGYSPYFLCVADYVRYAKSHGIVESTRGSAAGSLVSYVIGITTVDPMRFRLPFERFLNPFRPSAPDIDTDFADDRRQEMIEYVTKKYGEDRVAQIITFGSMQARAAVRDVGRALGLSYNFCDQVAKLIPPGAQGFPMTIERALNEEPDLKKLYSSNDEVKRLLDLAQQVEGCARHTSIHAAGVVISPSPLTDFTPIQHEVGGGKITTQYDMRSVEAAGLLKNDFLGIRNLTMLGKAVEIVKVTRNEDVDIYHLPLDDKKTFDMLARGETMGLFQLAGSGMTRWLKELKPTTIDDIMAMVALYRPGPMDVIPEYIRRKHHPETIAFLDPRMKEYLEASFGLLVYQDDVMLTAITLAGYDWMEADKFRKAMGKKIPEEMAQQKIKFYDGCKNYGKLSKDLVDELWRAIEPFAAYGFNKAHAASYGMVAYQTGYMKANYTVEYMTAILHAEAQDIEKVSAIVGECRRIGIDVLPPDVNESFKNFAMVSKAGEKGRIRFGLSTIKNVGEHICEVIFRERKANGPYHSLEDFLKRVQDKDMNKRSLESLIKAGALDCFGHDRGVLLANLEQLLAFGRHVRESAETKQSSLFAGTAIGFDERIVLKAAPEATIDERLAWEKELLGLYISSHPVTKYASAFQKIVTDIIDVEHANRDSWVICIGVVDSTKKKITKKGSVMLFSTIQDTTGAIEVLIFPNTYERTKTLWVEGAVLCVIGKTPRESGDNKIFVENVYALTPDTAEHIAQTISLGSEAPAPKSSGQAGSKRPKTEPALHLCLSKEDAGTHKDAIRTLCEQYPGEHRVVVEIGQLKIRTEMQCDARNTEFIDAIAALIGGSGLYVTK